MAKRLKAMGSAKYQADGDPRTSGPGFLATEHADTLTVPLSWRTPRRVFVNSMSDLFHDHVSDEFIARVWAVMAATPQHTYQVLTKRHGRMRAVLSDPGFEDLVREHWDELREQYPNQAADVPGWRWYPTHNVWLGVSVEDQKWANIRVPALLGTPAAVRFLSCEPLLGPVDLSAWLAVFESMEELFAAVDDAAPALDWVIVGGESGKDARPMAPNWARQLRDQCVNAGIPFCFKQWGAWAPTGQVGIGTIDPRERLAGKADERGFREVIRYVGKTAAGRTLDGRIWDGTPTTKGGAQS